MRNENAKELSGRKVLVLGLGDTGLSMAQWLARHGAGLRVADTRERPPALDTLTVSVPGAEVVTGPFKTLRTIKEGDRVKPMSEERRKALEAGEAAASS